MYPAIAALTPSKSLALYASGSLVRVDKIEFEYQGPPRNLAFAWGLKPKTSFWGTNFNNGQNLVLGAWVWTRITVQGAQAFYPVSVYPSGASFVVPTPGVQLLRSGALGTLAGWVDTWVWITDLDAITGAGGWIDEGTVTTEEFILAIDSDSEQVHVELPPAQAEVQPSARNLQVGYRLF